MPTTLGSLRRLVLTPAFDDVSFARRGFPVAPSNTTRQLEAIPQTVICGFEWGMDVRDQNELECRLELVEPSLRGFAYEGATMALTVLDAMRGGRGHKARDLLQGAGERHLLLAYIGIGFAMSHLPRPLWKRVVPDLTGSPYYPTMSWLAVDGYGFDRAYFDTPRWVDRQQQPVPYPWEGAPNYFPRAFDQGVGRALWFIHGAQVEPVTAAVSQFATARQADLWSGVGLAATFAGGCRPEDLAALRRTAYELSPEFGAHLGQGAVFAATARSLSGFVPDHSAQAITALTGLSTAAAVALADDTRADGPSDDQQPRYELWRRNIRARLDPVRPAS